MVLSRTSSIQGRIHWIKGGGQCGLRDRMRCCIAAPHKPRLSYLGRHHPNMSHAWSPDGASAQSQIASPERLKCPIISKSDEDFRNEYVEFVWGMDDLDLEELNDLFNKVNFPKRDLDKLRKALDNTYAIVWVRSTRNSRWAKMGQLLGFARAFSDKALTATIWDVAVHPAWQKGGLGRGMMERLTAFLVQADIQTICLYAEPNVIALYEKLGYVKDPYGVKGMAFRAESKPGRALLASAA